MFQTQPILYSVNIQRTLSDGETCEYTGQGKIFVTDDQGYVCKWKEWNAMSLCCKETEQTSIPRFSCQNCNTSASCCSIYEFCVSCCMEPDRSFMREHVSRKSDSPILKNAKNTFEFCKGVCRTNSKSIYLQNKYRNEDKYCYGIDAPPLQNTTETPVAPVNLIDSSSGNSSPRINSNPATLESVSPPVQNEQELEKIDSQKGSHTSVSTSFTGSQLPLSSSQSFGNTNQIERTDSAHDISASAHNDESMFKFGVASRDTNAAFSILSLQCFVLMDALLLLLFVF